MTVLDYDLLIAETPIPRAERINIGLILWRNGRPEFLVDRTSQRRLSALDPNWPRLQIFRQLADGTLEDALSNTLDKLEDIQSKRAVLGMLISPMKAIPSGQLFSQDADFTNVIDRAMNSLVRRSPLVVKAERRKAVSKLQTQMKHWFRDSKILGRNMEDLSKNRVVSNFPVSVDADVYADFAYKNGALHVIETLDMRGAEHVTTGLRNTAAFKSITLDMAADVVGNGKRIGIVAASDYPAIKSALRLFERNADEVFSMDSPDDTQRLANLLSTGLHIDGGLIPMDLTQ